MFSSKDICSTLTQPSQFSGHGTLRMLLKYFFLLSRAQEHVTGDFPVYCSSPSVSHLPYTVPIYTIQPFCLRSQLIFQREPQTHLYNTHTHTKRKSELLCISYNEIKLVFRTAYFSPNGKNHKFKLEPPVSLVNMKLKQGELNSYQDPVVMTFVFICSEGQIISQ